MSLFAELSLVLILGWATWKGETACAGDFLAGAARRKRVSFRKMRVKDFNSFVKLLGPSGLKILKLLGFGNTASQAANVVDCTKPNITYWKNKLLRLHLLKLQHKDVCKIYSLTKEGLKVLTRSEDVIPVEIAALEDYAVKFFVVEHEKRPIEWRKLGEPQNWVKLGVRIGSCRVVKTSRNVIIHPGKLKGWDTKELLFDSGRIVEMVKNILETRYGMVLSDAAFPLHKPIFRFYSEEAKEIVKHGTIIVHDKKGERLGSIDASPPERVPHEEYNGEQLGAARALFPVTLIRLEEKVDVLTDSVVKLVQSMEKFTDGFQRLIEPRESPSPKSLEKKVDYVA